MREEIRRGGDEGRERWFVGEDAAKRWMKRGKRRGEEGVGDGIGGNRGGTGMGKSDACETSSAGCAAGGSLEQRYGENSRIRVSLLLVQ